MSDRIPMRSILLACLIAALMWLSGCTPDEESTGDKGTCEPGERISVDCNTCECTNDRDWACTERACPDSGDTGEDVVEDTAAMDTADDGSTQDAVTGDDATVQPDAEDTQSASDTGATDTSSPNDTSSDVERCTPGETRQVDCNTCMCGSDGTWGCTKRLCQDAGSDTGADSGSPADSGMGECTRDVDCMTTGCSGQLCAAQPIGTTCEWEEEYACYQQYGDCGCNDGQCGWAQTSELTQCLGN